MRNVKIDNSSRESRAYPRSEQFKIRRSILKEYIGGQNDQSTNSVDQPIPARTQENKCVQAHLDDKLPSNIISRML